MIKYFLSEKVINKFFVIFQTFIIIIVITPLIITWFYKDLTSELSNILLSVAIFAFLLELIGLKFLSLINETFIYDTNWKKIYTNDINTNVNIATNSSCNIIVAGEKLDYKYEFFTYYNNQAKIIIEKDNVSYSKKVNINIKNIIINGELNENSKITKIEYRKIQGVQKYLFSYEGPIEKTDIDGELRITIDEDPKQKELKQLFELDDK